MAVPQRRQRYVRVLLIVVSSPPSNCPNVPGHNAAAIANPVTAAAPAVDGLVLSEWKPTAALPVMKVHRLTIDSGETAKC
jgi:hypothetical protein